MTVGRRFSLLLHALRIKLWQLLFTQRFQLPTDVVAQPTDEQIAANWDCVSAQTKYDGKRIPDSDGVTLYRLIKHFKPGQTLEIGYWSGAGTIAICSGLRDLNYDPQRQHIAIDIDTAIDGQENVKTAGLSGFARFELGDSPLVLPRLVSEGVKVDFAFIDGNHRFDFCLIDFFYCDRMLECGGILAIHDVCPSWPAVWKMVSFLKTNRAYEALGRCSGIELFKKLRNDIDEGPVFDRDAYFFVDF